MPYRNKSLLAREFRNNPTPSEKKLWKFIRGNRVLGYSFRRQYVIAGFILDFYCPALRLGVEVDGKIHSTLKNQTYDSLREHIINQNKIRIIRFTNEQIDADVELVVRSLKNHIKEITQNYFL